MGEGEGGGKFEEVVCVFSLIHPCPLILFGVAFLVVVFVCVCVPLPVLASSVVDSF